MSGRYEPAQSQFLVEALRHTPRDTQLDVETLNECSDYWETVVPTICRSIRAQVRLARLYQHEIPAASTRTCREQATAMA